MTALLREPFFRAEGVPLTPGQQELRKLVLKQVESQPETFDMDYWEDNCKDYRTGVCRTTRCIAGWAQFFARGAVDEAGNDYDIVQDAITLLGLTRAEYFHGAVRDGLFYVSSLYALQRLRKLAGEEPE